MEQVYFKKVEEVLQNFPSEWSKNYYANKKNLKINYEEAFSKNFSGSYDHDTNMITIFSKDALPHELFHMAFRDEEKISKKIIENSDFYYANGVSFFRYQNDEKIFYNKGLTEGMTEYLSRKCSFEEGHSFEYFFTNLLISIYGEEVLKYSFQNDPIGLLIDERFSDIFYFLKQLDLLAFCVDEIIFVSNFKSTLENVLKTGKEKVAQQIMEMIDTNRKNYKTSIVSLFESIIEEYIHCQSPMIDKDSLIQKLEEFFKEPSYLTAFSFDDSEYSVKEEVTRIIQEFKNQDLKRLKK